MKSCNELRSGGLVCVHEGVHDCGSKVFLEYEESIRGVVINHLSGDVGYDIWVTLVDLMKALQNEIST